MRIAMVLLGALLTQVGIGAGQSMQVAQRESTAPKGATHVTVNVADETGAAIPYAVVKYRASSELFGHSTRTDIYGRAFLDLLPGGYDIGVTSQGFGTWHKGLEVDGAENQTISFPLVVHQCTQCVEIVPAYSAAQPPAGRIPFSIQLRVPRNRSIVRPGERIMVTATVAVFRDNFFSETTRRPRTVYTVDVRDANGETPPRSKLLMRPGGAAIGDTRTDMPDGERGWITIFAHPREYLTEDIDLSSLYDLTRSGVYTVFVSRYDYETETSVKSNPVSFTVVPKETPQITIEVTDPSGAGVPNAKIWFGRSLGTVEQVTYTDRNGRVDLNTAWEPGSYDIEVSSPGFATFHKRLDLPEIRSQTISVVLQVGQCMNCVQVISLGPVYQRAATTISVEDSLGNGQELPSDLKALLTHGNELFAQQHYVGAAAEFERALPLAKGKTLVAVETRLAESCLNAQHYAEAIKHFENAVALDPSDAALHNSLGIAYAQWGQLPEAQAQFKKSAELNPAGASHAFLNLGVSLYYPNEMDEAIEAFRKAKELDPTNADAYQFLGLALWHEAIMDADGNEVAPPAAIEALKTYLRLQPKGLYARWDQEIIKKGFLADPPTQ